MFLHLLDRDQASAFIGLLSVIAHTDERIDAAEDTIAEQLARELDMPVTLTAAADRQEVLARTTAAFDGAPVAARAALLELAGVAVIDGEANAAEQHLLAEVAAAVGVPADQVDAFLAFGERARDLARDGQLLIAGTSVEV